MDGSIRLSARERNILLQEARRGSDAQRRLRAHILVLLNDGLSWNVICAALFTSASTINRWRHRYLAEGLAAVLESKRCRQPRWSWVVALVIHWVTAKWPGVGHGLCSAPKTRSGRTNSGKSVLCCVICLPMRQPFSRTKWT